MKAITDGDIVYGSRVIDFNGIKYIAEQIEEEPWAIIESENDRCVRQGRIRIVLLAANGLKLLPIPNVGQIIPDPISESPTGDTWEVWRAVRRHRYDDTPKIEVELIPAREKNL